MVDLLRRTNLLESSGFQRSVRGIAARFHSLRAGFESRGTMSIYGPRGTTWGSEGYSDAYEVGSKRQRAVDSANPYFTMGPTGFLLPYNINYNSATVAAANFPAVRLRGLPFNCTETDVFKFFSGLDIVDCLLTTRNGRFSGEAYVVFASVMQAELALDRDQQNMGRRYVEVFRSKKQDYYAAVAAEVNGGGATGGEVNAGGKEHLEYTEVLKLRGLPFSATKGEIVNFFGGFGVREENVRVVVRADGRATGEAFVEFSSSEEAKRAMVKDRMTIGRRYVELFPSTPDEARRAEDGSRP